MSGHSPARWVLGLLLMLPPAGCGQSGAPTAATDATAPAVRGSAPIIPVYGLGGPRPSQPACRAAGFRGFDFWVGAWNVYAQDDNLVGTNEVTRELTGCAIEEHWTDGQGGRGRSLNTYDAGTGTWHQLWMDASGLALILDGEAAPGSMHLAGSSPRGIGGPIENSRITWTRVSEREVRQFWEISDDDMATWQTAFDGYYRRDGRVVPAAEAPTGFCDSPARVRFHWFDFIMGNWVVRRESRTGQALGKLDVTKDLSGCLMEVQFQGERGYRGRAFAAFHFPTLTWHRTWIDDEGVRIALTGGLDGANMVFTGRRTPVHGAPQELRVTWEPVDNDTVNEHWEISNDGGTSWTSALEIVLTRRT